VEKNKLFRLSGAADHEPEIDAWLSGEPAELFALARHWFGQIRLCGNDVSELLHDGCPTACVEDAAFAYVNVFTAHVNVGFFNGASLTDPQHLLQGSGKRMRHVKLRPGDGIDTEALASLIQQAYQDLKDRLIKAD